MGHVPGIHASENGRECRAELSGLCVRLLQCSAVSWVPFLGYVTVTVSRWERVQG